MPTTQRPEGGRDQWISASRLLKQADGSYVGALQRPLSGTPLAQISGAATSFPVPEIGSATLRFSLKFHGDFRRRGLLVRLNSMAYAYSRFD